MDDITLSRLGQRDYSIGLSSFTSISSVAGLDGVDSSLSAMKFSIACLILLLSLVSRERFGVCLELILCLLLLLLWLLLVPR